MAKAPGTNAKRVLNARPDTIDFRDLMYVPTLVEVPQRIPLDKYAKVQVPVLDQGQEGACTGFGLATVVHYLLHTRHVDRDLTPISTRMLYEMARRYDEWPGENYSGSSARGAMKGWHKHGVCADGLWPYDPNTPDKTLTNERVKDATGRPLGAYFRVNHKDLVAMHAALAEVGILYATATVHDGWNAVDAKGAIPYKPGSIGGHAFAIVAYDENGFWIQNSWGPGWGKNGFGHVTYLDWLANGTDVWVARLGVPVKLPSGPAGAAGRSTQYSQSDGASHAEVRPHVISIGNNGVLRDWGTYGTSQADVDQILQCDLPRVTSGWRKRRVLLYAHGGLVGERNAIQRVAEYLPALLGSEVYPISFVWKSDAWTTITNILQDAIRQRRPEGFLDAAKDFMLDRLDDGLEVMACMIGGPAIWEEMKENALFATTDQKGGARYALGVLDKLIDAQRIEIHLAGHSAGSIFLAPIVQLLTTPKDQGGLGRKIASCTLWAPACTTALFKETYLPAIESGAIERFRLFTLTDKMEQDDNCAGLYHKSLLYLVAHALESAPRIPIVRPHGTPLLGMEKSVLADRQLRQTFKTVDPADGSAEAVTWIRTPNKRPAGSPLASGALHHGDFDDDPATVQALLATITSLTAAKKVAFFFSRSRGALGARRRALL